jgi:DNA-binding Lrp family transcriptional regulator
LPVDLDQTDIAIMKSLMKDGRKSFHAISREIKVSTPTVKSRYKRLVNIGLIKSVKPEIDLSKVDRILDRFDLIIPYIRIANILTGLVGWETDLT